jgi:Periplasmic glycine betaine/choline-binding (lipo)protein of an ABC-type transport system (osmoprotectant binding protein)
MRKGIIFIWIISLNIVFLIGCSSKGEGIVVGSKDFTEQDILGNILTILIEENTDIAVEYKHEMASNIIFSAIQSGDVDVYIDYTGTVYGNYLEYSEMRTADEVYDISLEALAEKYDLRMLEPLGFNNTFCIAIRADIAEAYNIVTYSDLALISSEFVFVGGFEILNRKDGIPELKKVYNLTFAEERAVEGILRYTAIENNEAQVTEAFSTDALLLEYDLVVLEDDKNFFPPYHAVPIIREETVQKYPELLPVLDRLTGIFSDDIMRDLNYRVDVLKENPRDVAIEFLRANGLIG